MKRISMMAAAALLVAGTQLHAQASKQDTSKKTAKHAPAAQAGTAKTESKVAAKSADTSHKVASKTVSASKKGAAKTSAKKDSTTKKKP